MLKFLCSIAVAIAAAVLMVLAPAGPMFALAAIAAMICTFAAIICILSDVKRMAHS